MDVDLKPAHSVEAGNLCGATDAPLLPFHRASGNDSVAQNQQLIGDHPLDHRITGRLLGVQA